MKISIRFLLLFFTVLLAYSQGQSTFGQLNVLNLGGFRSPGSIPFPQCFESESAKQLLQPEALHRRFDAKLFDEDRKLKQERNRNINLNNSKISKCGRDFSEDFSSISIEDDIMDFDEMQLRADNLNGPLLSRAATKASEEILQQYEMTD